MSEAHIEPRLIKNLHADYVPALWSGADTSGIRCIGKTVLVLMDQCSETTTGGISLPPELIERMNAASESGMLVAVAPGAFLLNEDMTPYRGEKPAPGQRVYVDKYAGKLVRGKDGMVYRIRDYTCIGAVYDPDDGQDNAQQAETETRQIEVA